MKNLYHYNTLHWFVCLFVCLMVLNATFNNISVVSWWSVLLVEETGGPLENHRPVTSHWQTLLDNVVHLALIEIRTHNISRDRHCTSLKTIYTLCGIICLWMFHSWLPLRVSLTFIFNCLSFLRNEINSSNIIKWYDYL